AAFGGLAGAAATPALCLQAAGSPTREARVLAHPPEAIDAGGCPRRQRFGGPPVAVWAWRATKAPWSPPGAKPQASSWSLAPPCPWRGPGLRPPAAGRLWRTPCPLYVRCRTATRGRPRAGHGTPRQASLGPWAPAMADVPPTKPSRKVVLTKKS